MKQWKLIVAVVFALVSALALHVAGRHRRADWRDERTAEVRGIFGV